MSKSKNNYVGISEDANSMFAKALSISDTLMWRWFTLLSFRSDGRDRRALEVDGGRNPKRTPRCCWPGNHGRFHSAAADDGGAGLHQPQQGRRA